MVTRWIGVLLMLVCSTVVVRADETLDVRLSEACNQAVVLRREGKMAESIRLLESTAVEAQKQLDPASDAGESLQRALDESKPLAEPSARQTRLYWGLQEAKLAINYSPIMEAELPEGFPPPGKVFMPIIKQYPAYRAARTPMQGDKGDENQAFWRLFNHIKSRGVPMTAPVEMVYEKPVDSGGKPVSMSFMYESQSQGAREQDGAVEVVDLPALTVLSIGMRGNFDPPQRARAMQKLHAWLNEQKDSYQVVGPMRVLGYNSPFVLPMLRYYEVQVPVTKSEKTD